MALLLAVVALATACQTQSPINQEPRTGTTTAAAGADGVQNVEITTGDDYRFHPSTITVHPGKVKVTLRHTGNGAPHDWALTALAQTFSVPLINGGQSKSVEFTAPAPGSYRFVCTIHTTQGQTGTFVVLPE